MGLMVLESSGMILYVAKNSYQSDNWLGNCWGWGGPKFYTHTPDAYFMSFFFFQKRNKTKKEKYCYLMETK